MLDYDDVLDEVGEFGRWQIWLFALLWIPSAVSAMQVSGDFFVIGYKNQWSSSIVAGFHV